MVKLSQSLGLRVLWVCENNKYGMGTVVERASAVLDIQQKAEGYGMKNAQVDGMDVMKVYEWRKRPSICPHGGPALFARSDYVSLSRSLMGDPERYRKQEEVKKMAGE